ncbi:MAG: SAM-dependent methyltransferase [Bacteroidia bacterium]
MPGIITFEMMQHNPGKLYLIPNFLDEESSENFIPGMVSEKIKHLKYFFAETPRQARRSLKKMHLDLPLEELKIFTWNKKQDPVELRNYLKILMDGNDAGILSDAGLPCIADPGKEIVELAHKNNIEVIPLPGSSSIFMALMASGMNGQQFVFHGYLPVEKKQLAVKLKEIESEALKKNSTQIFMETPYRNNHLFTILLESCKNETRICVAADISSPAQFIKTKTVREWRSSIPDLNKRPAIFLMA